MNMDTNLIFFIVSLTGLVIISYCYVNERIKSAKARAEAERTEMVRNIWQEIDHLRDNIDTVHMKVNDLEMVCCKNCPKQF